MKLRTWHLEAAAEAALYLVAIVGQHGTLARPELLLGAAFWLLGRAASRADRQRERYERDGLTGLLQEHAVECAGGLRWDLRFATLAFGGWGLYLGSWLTLANVAWTVAYPLWRRGYRLLTETRP
jgi:hypothetical protein